MWEGRGGGVWERDRGVGWEGGMGGECGMGWEEQSHTYQTDQMFS